jgi:hypothetical protein
VIGVVEDTIKERVTAILLLNPRELLLLCSQIPNIYKYRAAAG